MFFELFNSNHDTPRISDYLTQCCLFSDPIKVVSSSMMILCFNLSLPFVSIQSDTSQLCCLHISSPFVFQSKKSNHVFSLHISSPFVFQSKSLIICASFIHVFSLYMSSILNCLLIFTFFLFLLHFFFYSKQFHDVIPLHIFSFLFLFLEILLCDPLHFFSFLLLFLEVL